MSQAEIQVLGVTVHPVAGADLARLLSSAVRDRRRAVVGNHNLHSVYLSYRQPEFRRFYERADIVFVDGMPLVALARLKGLPLRRGHRCTPLDWIDDLLAAASAGRWRVFLLGARPRVADRAVEQFSVRFPGVTFATRHGYFDVTAESADTDAVVEQINRFAPDVLLVGMGMPRQELWLADQADRLNATVAIAVGGLFDYFAGESRTPPRWMGRIGLEWLFRLADDPRRLAYRYLVEPFLLLGLLIREWTK
jgi:N-acetylglucosaminyldiphosphoundecaprenol N-acetyl-beta-D-mannosaminyltransferase